MPRLHTILIKSEYLGGVGLKHSWCLSSPGDSSVQPKLKKWVVQRPTELESPDTLLDLQNLVPSQNHSVPFTNIPRLFMCMLQFQKHCSRTVLLKLQPCIRIPWKACENTGFWALTPGFQIQQAWNAAGQFTFLTSLQVLLLLLLMGPTL